MSAMDDLTAFVRERLDDDERELQKDPPVGLGYANLSARMRLEIAAKRAIVGFHQPEWTDYVDGDGIERGSYECAECEPGGTPNNWPCRTMRQLAAVYSADARYRAEWAPAVEGETDGT